MATGVTRGGSAALLSSVRRPGPAGLLLESTNHKNSTAVESLELYLYTAHPFSMSRTDLRAQAAVPFYSRSWLCPSPPPRQRLGPPQACRSGNLSSLAARDRRRAVALEAPKSEFAIAVAVAVALAGVAPIIQKAQKATSASVNMAILELPPNLTTAAAGAAHCVGGEVVVIVVATPARVPDVIRAGVVPRVNVYCAIVSVDALSGAAVVRCQSLVLGTVELGRRDDRLRAGRVGRGVLEVHVLGRRDDRLRAGRVGRGALDVHVLGGGRREEQGEVEDLQLHCACARPKGDRARPSQVLPR
eukprot:scaffold66034_cov66-Phaeocystis_antarctica.AAC.4